MPILGNSPCHHPADPKLPPCLLPLISQSGRGGWWLAFLLASTHLSVWTRRVVACLLGCFHSSLSLDAEGGGLPSCLFPLISQSGRGGCGLPPCLLPLISQSGREEGWRLAVACCGRTVVLVDSSYQINTSGSEPAEQTMHCNVPTSDCCTALRHTRCGGWLPWLPWLPWRFRTSPAGSSAAGTPTPSEAHHCFRLSARANAAAHSRNHVVSCSPQSRSCGVYQLKTRQTAGLPDCQTVWASSTSSPEAGSKVHGSAR